jgi:hypothetical protein
MKRALQRLAVFFVASFALIGVMHMPFARDLLQSAGGCPFPTTDRVLTPREAEALRVATLAPTKSLSAAPEKPALGFSLETTRREDVMTWARDHSIACAADRHGAGLTCANVMASQLPSKANAEVRGTLMLGFASDARLVSVHFLSRDSSRERVRSRAEEATQRLASLDAPIHSEGNLGLERPLAQGRRSVAFRDYRAEIAATHVGSAFTVSESYQAFGP